MCAAPCGRVLAHTVCMLAVLALRGAEFDVLAIYTFEAWWHTPSSSWWNTTSFLRLALRIDWVTQGKGLRSPARLPAMQVESSEWNLLYCLIDKYLATNFWKCLSVETGCFAWRHHQFQSNRCCTFNSMLAQFKSADRLPLRSLTFASIWLSFEETLLEEPDLPLAKGSLNW